MLLGRTRLEVAETLAHDGSRDRKKLKIRGWKFNVGITGTCSRATKWWTAVGAVEIERSCDYSARLGKASALAKQRATYSDG